MKLKGKEMIEIKQLVVFTSHYPYYPGEQFFETEIGFLAKEFDKIYLVPVSRVDPDSEKRPVPANAETLSIDSSRNILALLPFIYFKDIAKEITSNMRILTSPASLKKMMSYLYRRYIIDRWLYEFLYNKKSDDVYLYSYWMNEPAYAIAKYKRYRLLGNVKKICRAHAHELYRELYHPAYLPFRQDIISNIDRIFPISQDGLDYLKRNYEIDDKKLVLARLGVKDNNILSSKSPDSVLRIATCSRLVSIKRIPLLARSLKLIKDINIEWTHMGGGPEEETVKEIVKSMPQNIKVHLTGDIPNSDVMNFYRTHPVDLFLNVSQNEGLPVSIMEAISYGIPVIATDVGAVKEIVTEKIGILLKKDLESETLANAIIGFYQLDESAKDKMRKNARAMYLKNYNCENNYKKFIENTKIN